MAEALRLKAPAADVTKGKGWERVVVFLETLVSGLLIGCVYALVGTGLTLTMGLSKVMNVAHGALAILGAYLTLTLFQGAHLDPIVGAALTVPAFLLLGLALEVTVVAPIRHLDETVALLVLFGVAVVVENVASMVWTTNTQVLTASFTNASWTVAHLTIPDAELVSAALAVVVSGLVYLFLRATFVGAAIRAAAQNEEAAVVLGVPVARLQGLVFALGVVLAGLGGAAIALNFPFAPNLQVQWLIWAFVVVVVGGVEDVAHTFLAGLAVGVAQALGSLVVSFQYVDFVVYTFLALALLARSRLGGSSVRAA